MDVSNNHNNPIPGSTNQKSPNKKTQTLSISNSQNNMKSPKIIPHKKSKGFLSKVFSNHKTPSKPTHPTSLYEKSEPQSKAIKVKANFNKTFSSFPPVNNNSIKYEIIEPKPFTSSILNQNNQTYYPFIESILINGLSSSKVKFIPNSLLYPSSCNHNKCSILPALTPHLLQFRKTSIEGDLFLDIDSKLDCISFPLGVKLCYECKFKDKDAFNTPKTDDMYFNIIRDKKGDSHYIVSFIYYKIYSVSEFKDAFKLDPITEYTIQISQYGKNVKEEQIQQNFNIISKFVLNESILVPESISLVSNFPYINQMKTSLKHIMAIRTNKLKDVIEHIMNQVHIMINNHHASVLFYLPRSSEPIELQPVYKPKEQNPNNNDISGLNYGILFSYLSIRKIIYIYHLLLLEKSIVFVSKENKKLCETMLIFLNLMTPLNWKNVYTPFLPCFITLSLQSPTPFFFGMHPEVLNLAISNNEFQTESTFIINLDKETSLTIKESNNPTLIDLPTSLYDLLHSELEKIKTSLKTESDTNKINVNMSKVFTKGLVSIFGEYKRFVFYTENYAVPIVDKIGFITYIKDNPFHKESKYVKLMEEILNTQNFTQFLLAQKENFFNVKEYFNNEIELYINEKQNKQTYKSKIRSSSVSRAHSLSKKHKQTTPSKPNINLHLNENNNILNNNIIPSCHALSQTKGDILSILSHNSLQTSDNHKFVLNSLIPSNGNNNGNSNCNLTKVSSDGEKEVKKFILYPYFFQDNNKITQTSKESIENIITENLHKDQLYDVAKEEEHCYLIPKSKNKFACISNNSNTMSNKKYTIPTGQVLIFGTSFSQENNKLIMETHDKKILYTFFKEIVVNKTIPENTETILNTYFNYEDQLDQHKTELKNNNITGLNNLTIKLFFCKYLIFNLRLYSENQYKLLNNAQFDLITTITKNCLITKLYLSKKEKEILNKEDFLMYKGYTIVAFSYYKVTLESKKRLNAYFIYEELNQLNIKSDLWLNEMFWQFFILDEIEKSESTSNYDEVLNIMKTICSIMKKLKLSLFLIKKSLLGAFGMKLLFLENKYDELENYIISE